jgi:hypothetical protein
MNCNKTWVVGLLKQIHLMSNGFGVSSYPLLVDDLETMPMGSPSCIMITTCPICEKFFKCHNILVLSCGYTYHSFCLGLHLETNATHCVIPTCWKLLSAKWLVSYGFQQKFQMVFKRPKQEKGCNNLTWSTMRSLQGSISPTNK